MKKKTGKKKGKIILTLLAAILIFAAAFLMNETIFFEKNAVNADYTSDFRFTGTVGQFSTNGFSEGMTYSDGENILADNIALEQYLVDQGITEMFARVNTLTAHFGVPIEGTYDGLEACLNACEIAKACGIPINIELTCAKYYMDMSYQEAPDFRYYPEVFALQNGKTWQELDLDTMCRVLEEYGKAVAQTILDTGAAVSCWNLGNEANFGFAGVSVGLKNGFNKLDKANSILMYMIPTYGAMYLKNHCWNYDGILMASLEKGILAVDPNARFSTHIATAVADYSSTETYYKTLIDNGVKLDYLGLSIYPSAPSQHLNFVNFYKKLITRLNKKFDIPVYIAEYAYPAADMTSGGYKSWNVKASGCEHTEEDQYNMARFIVSWGAKHGVAGIRFWAPDAYGTADWGPMGFFDYDEKTGTAVPRKIIRESISTLLDENH